jgi:hypothetical protein
MYWKRLSSLAVILGVFLVFGCGATSSYIMPYKADEKLFSQVPDEQKNVINPLLEGVSDAKDRLELAKAMVDKKNAELDLEKEKKGLANIQLQVSEAELNLGKMKAVQSAGLGDAKKVNQQVAKLEAKVYSLKGDEAEQKAKVENAKLAVAEAQEKIKDLEARTQQEGIETETKE